MSRKPPTPVAVEFIIPPKRKRPRIAPSDVFKFWMKRRLYRPLGTLLFRDQLLRNYMHLGFRQRQTSQASRSLILGSYRGVSVFNPSLLTFFFRRAAKMILLLLLRGNRLCLVSKDLGHHFPRNDLLFPGQLMTLNYWLPGVVSNFHKLLNQTNREKIMIPSFPQMVIMIKMDPYKLFSIAQECHNAGVPSIGVLDSNVDPALFDYYVLANTKNMRSLIFFVSFLSQLIKRTLVLKKVRFVNNVFK